MTSNAPIEPSGLSRADKIEEGICPECSGVLDTGWECNDCGYDAMLEALEPGGTA